MKETPLCTARLDEALARSRTYRFLGSLFLREPDDRVIQSMRTLSAACRRDGQAPGSPANMVEEDPTAIRQDHHDLFRVPGGKYVTPFESVYRGRAVTDGGERPGPLGGPLSAQVERFYRECGLKLDYARFRELPDHVGSELAFLERLCAEEHRALRDGDDDLARGCRRVERMFLERHLNLWVKALSEEIGKKSGTEFYLEVAQLLESFVSDELETLRAEVS